MNRVLILLLTCSATVFVPSNAFANFDFLNSLLPDPLDEEENQNEERFLIAATSGVPFNASQLATIVGLLATALLPLLILTTISLVMLGYLWHSDDGNSGQYSSYSRSLGLDGIDWESFSILNWLGAAEETYRNLNPSDLDCQKRLICELHQNTTEFGSIATKAVEYFAYLKYLEVFRVPASIKQLADEYIDASQRATVMKADCADLYADCRFSIKRLHDKYFHTNLI